MSHRVFGMKKTAQWRANFKPATEA